jgi:hypothetical protein
MNYGCASGALAAGQRYEMPLRTNDLQVATYLVDGFFDR